MESCCGNCCSDSVKPTDLQTGGDHYKDYLIQPVQFIHINGIPFIEGNVIKYVLRHRSKNGLEDLLKAKHYIDLLIEMEYDEDTFTYSHNED